MNTLIRSFRRLRPKTRALGTIAKEDGNGGKTHFGYEEVSFKEKEERVNQVFHDVANKYDLMNDCSSLGIHRIWKDIFVERLGPTPGIRVLDVAGGTGDISFRVAKSLSYQPKSEKKSIITVYDVNKSMLRVGEERGKALGLSNDLEWVEGDAQDLSSIPDNSYNAYTIVFGIRNVARIEKALQEAHRVLCPGGRFLCMEFSQVNNKLISFLYNQYSFQVIPVMGQIVCGDWKPYQYLVESIRKFPSQDDFALMIEDAGFRMVDYENLTFGVVAIHSGFKL